MKRTVAVIYLLLICSFAAAAQVPINVGVQILKAEDARRYDKTLEDLMKSPNPEVRTRAALAAGRIGREEAIPTLAGLLTNDSSEKVRVMAAFALGEIESIKAADAVLTALRAETLVPTSVRARLVEAAGKIAAANANSPQAKVLQIFILDQLKAQAAMGIRRDFPITLLGLTAALRAKPDGVDVVVAKFLSDPDARIRVDALNTLARLRSKQSLPEIRSLLERDADPIVRANATRALGAVEDKDALDLLLRAATTGKDSRVRVSAIRALGSLKEANAVKKLIERGNALMAFVSKSKGAVPAEMNELLEIATTLGRILPNTQNDEAMYLLNEFLVDDRLIAPEVFVAMAAIYPSSIASYVAPTELGYANPKFPAAYAQGVATLAASKDSEIKAVAEKNLRSYIDGIAKNVQPDDKAKFTMAMPELVRALAAFKPADLDGTLRNHLANGDPFMRAVAAELLAERPKSKENINALKTAFTKSLVTDKHDNDAQLAIIDALFKLDKAESVGTLTSAMSSRDYLVRKKAYLHLKDDYPFSELPAAAQGEISGLVANGMISVYPPLSPQGLAKMGIVTKTDADYRRALSRKNYSVKAVLKTEKGTFTIYFYPEEAPLTVDNFIKLARSGYFNGLEVHRVVPNFVMQDGDPRGDGNGGPGWSIRCEINTLPYYRGGVGMALSGKDTGGSQWFVTHSPQPHLDGGYTVFGYVNETDMKVVDNIVRGDKILSVKIVGR